MKVRALYSLAELAKMGGFYTKDNRPDAERVARVLAQSGVPIQARNARCREVYLTDLQARVPELWQALLSAARSNGEFDDRGYTRRSKRRRAV